MNGEHAHHAVSLVHQREEASPAWRRPIVAGRVPGDGSQRRGNTGDGVAGRGEKVCVWGGVSQFRMGGGESGFYLHQSDCQSNAAPVCPFACAGEVCSRCRGALWVRWVVQTDRGSGEGGGFVDFMHSRFRGAALHKLADVHEKEMNQK